MNFQTRTQRALHVLADGENAPAASPKRARKKKKPNKQQENTQKKGLLNKTQTQTSKP